MKACKSTGNDCKNGKHTVRGTRAARTRREPLHRAREIALLQEKRRKARAVAQKESMRKNGTTPIESPCAHRKWSETGENKKDKKSPSAGKPTRVKRENTERASARGAGAADRSQIETQVCDARERGRARARVRRGEKYREKSGIELDAKGRMFVHKRGSERERGRSEYTSREACKRSNKANPKRVASAGNKKFDSTKGYPGEGPRAEIKIIGWNCGGIRDESSGKMTQMINWMGSRRAPDALLLQEHHLGSLQCEDMEMRLRQAGLVSKFTPRDDDSASRGTAIVIKLDNLEISREDVTFDGGENGTITTALIKKGVTKYRMASIYLPSEAGERQATIQDIITNGWIKSDTILEADHNMVEDEGKETQGQGPYSNAGHQQWFGHLAQTGLGDEERKKVGPRPHLFTRRGNTRSSRLDKFMMPDARSFHDGWQWEVTHETQITPFSSDHDPLVAVLVQPGKESFGRNKKLINKELLEEKWFRDKISAAYADTYRKNPTNTHGKEKVWLIWKKRLLDLWCSESEIRRGKNKSELEHWETMYANWIKKDQRRAQHWRPRSNQRIGHRIKENLKIARDRARTTKYRRVQELSTKEFHKKYKVPQGMQWIDKLKKTADWEHTPERKNGTTTNSKELLQEATKYYEWLYGEKKSEGAAEFLKLLEEHQLKPSDASKCEGEMKKADVFRVMKNLPRNKASGPDGIPNEYYKTFAKEIAEEYAAMMNEIHEQGSLSNCIKDGTITILYKKKDRDDIRNYRPITLLNGDYKILTRTLCKRMKKVIGRVVSRENTGFSPGRFISENTQQMKLMQAMLEENNEPGMFVFLDLEKAFDRVSWDYMQKAIEKLGFGKDFLKWVRILYDESNSPRRRLKINGHEGERFTLKCGTAQGCPLSPLLYLCVMEAFSRAVKADKKIKGIKVGRSELKLSQFADDTVLLLREFRSIKRVWDILRRIEKATGQRVNSDKTEGLLLGSLRNDARAPGWIKWCADGDYIISLGVPFGNDFEGSPQEIGFWRKIYHKTKTIMARWTAIFAMTMRGRVMIANSMVYSRFRYWTQVMMMPDDIIAWLEEDVHQLIWSKDPHFEGGQEGQQEKNKRKIKENTAKLAWKEGGIGLLVWKEHLKSLRKKWIVRYLDRERGAWKEVLDQWVLKGHTYGRGILLMGNTTPPTAPTVFWQKAIEEFQEMEVARAGRITEPSEAEEEPIWDGKEITTLRGLAHGSLWEDELGLRQVKDWLNRGTRTPIRGSKWLGWIRAKRGGEAHFGGRDQIKKDHGKIKNAVQGTVDIAQKGTNPTWKKGEIVAHYDEEGNMGLGRLILARRLTTFKKVELNTQGEAYDVQKIVTIPDQAYNERGEEVDGAPVWKTRWVMELPPDARTRKPKDKEERKEIEERRIQVFDGVEGITYPRVDSYKIKASTEEDEEKLMEMTVKQQTRNSVDKTTQRPTCERLGRWPVELQLNQNEKIDFSKVWNTFKVGIATPVDFGTRFRMIHGDLQTRSKRGEPGGCRLGCGCPTEKHIHLLRCSQLKPLWAKLRNILERLRGRPFREWEQAVILGWTTKDGEIEKGSVALASMLLKIIVIEWYRMLREQRNFDHQKVWRIFWSRAERQWKETARDKSGELRNIQQRNSNTLSTWKGIQRWVSTAETHR